MVKANVIPGKFLSFLLGILMGVILALGGLVGGGYYVYKNVKVESIFSLISKDNNWLSDEYAQKTLEALIKEVQNLANGDITLEKISEISPFVGEKIDAVLDNVNQNGIVTIDRSALYKTSINSLSSNLSDLVVVTSTLNSLGSRLGFSLPEMPLIDGGEEGAEIWIYSAVNDNESKSIDKAISYGDYVYYTKSLHYDTQVTAEKTTPLYALDGVSQDEEGYLKIGGKFVYLRSGETYEKIKSDGKQIESFEGERYLFSTDELYEKDPFAAEGAQYTKLAAQDAGSTVTFAVPAEYAWQKLYAKVGDEVVLATETDASGAPVADGGGYKILDEYRNCHLYAQTEVYGEAAGDTEGELLYVKTNGIGDLPVLFGITALSAALDVNTLTLNKVSEYFGVSMQNDILGDVLNVPLAYLSEALDEALQNTELASVLDLNADSSAVLLFLAYGEENVDYTIDPETREIVPINPPKTVAEATDSVDSLKIKNLVNVTDTSHSLLQTVQNWTLEDLGNSKNVDSIRLKDVVTITEESPQILVALQDAALGELSDKIQALTLEEMLGTIGEDNAVLYALKDCTLNSLADAVNALAVQDLFADEIYEYVCVGTLENYDERYTDLYVAEAGKYVKYDPELHTASGTELYAPYILAYENGTYAEGYENVPLYAYDEETGTYAAATEVTGWKLPAGADENAAYYCLEGGEYRLAEADAEGFYGYAELYYSDADENAARLKLIPAKLSVKEEYAEATLFSKIRTAEAANGEYDYANLYYFDMEAQAFKRAEATLNEETGKFTVSEQYAGVRLYTHGSTFGVWKYLLTQKTESGIEYEAIASINNIDSLTANVSGNINGANLRQLYNDGLLILNPPEGWTAEQILETEIGGDTLGDLTISQTINAIVLMITASQS